MNQHANQHSTQRDRLLVLLKDRVNEWIPLGRVMAVAGAQYGARVHELRSQGYVIENKTGWFRLVTRQISEAAGSTPVANQQPQEPAAEANGLFGNIGPDRSYRE